MDHLLDTRPKRPGYRLQRLDVFNWGTFDSTDGTVFRFEPQGRTSLLVGHNGSGKSTLVDAILTLLVDSRTRNYNVAAGAKKTERTQKSYIKGAFDRTADQSQSGIVRYLRPKGNHLTALCAVFRDEQLDRAFTLMQVLYLKADGADDKVFAIADEALDLKHTLAGLQKSNQVLDHLKRKGFRTTRTYVEYQGWLSQRTAMRGKAIDMFNQTVAVKDIHSLNTFIRQHMLEAQNWRDKVQRLLTHFNDLSVAHQELVRARRAEEMLAPVQRVGGKYRQQGEKIRQLERELDAATTFFPVLSIELFGPEITTQEKNVETAAAVIKRLDQELKAAREAIRQLKNEIERAGGERLKQIPALIKVEEALLERKRDAFTQYHANLKAARIDRVVGTREILQQTREELSHAVESSHDQIGVLKTQAEEAIGRKASILSQLREERSELEVLEQRRTNLPRRFAEMRGRICADLNLDDSVLPFAAELISVLPGERRWEASVEMVLRPFALSLLVPERYYPRVRTYVENNRVIDGRGDGQRLDYLCVGKAVESDGDRIDPRSLVHKLQLKPGHDLAPWIRSEIVRRFDFRCCESVDEFNNVQRLALTVNRHVKFNTQRHQKDDRARTSDPRHFVLGWDNTQKKRHLVARIRELECQRGQLVKSTASFEQRIEELQSIRRAAQAALNVTDFDSIDIRRHQIEIASLRDEKKQLEESNDAVIALRKRLQAAEAQE